MIEITGKYATAKIFTDTVDESAIAQIQQICDSKYAEGAKIRIMPDVHSGIGCTIGTTMSVSDRLIPNLVGVDIGCGMETALLDTKRIELARLDNAIRKRIPLGFAIREEAHRMAEEIDLSTLRCYKKINTDYAYKSLGTLGGGNHFIEADRSDSGEERIYLVIHSGSRHAGGEVAAYYQEEGYKQLCNCDIRSVNALIEKLKSEGRDKEISSAIKELKATKTDIPYELAYVTGQLFDDYIHDMKIMTEYAELNRRIILHEILKEMKFDVAEVFTTVHNYIDTEAMILRKGAVSARAGEKLLIPINMRDGSLICIGKGNEDWNFSAPHGAGRLYGRKKAKNLFSLSQFKKEMENIYTTSVDENTIDECPMVYKPMDEIIGNIKPTAEIISVIKPIYNCKASEEAGFNRGKAKKDKRD